MVSAAGPFGRPLSIALVAGICHLDATASFLRSGARLSVGQQDSMSTCTALKNMVTHFTVGVKIGTPPQSFDVVADTGSDSLIVESCMCEQTKSCFSKSRCFRGTNRSSTFSLKKMKPQSNALTRGSSLPAVVLSFGSGPVEALIASDMVRVGRANAYMKEGLLLMVDQGLRLSGPFEGILGLGLPQHKKPAQLLEKPALAREVGRHAGSPFEDTEPPADGQELQYEPKGFLETVGASQFSMCFNDRDDGVLRLGGPAMQRPLGSVGQVHWGLDFRGVSIGGGSASKDAPVLFCGPDSKLPGQATACGAIPDSGTTVMTGPTQHLKELFTGICDAWTECRDEAAKSDKPPFHVFQLLLEDCGKWPQNGKGYSALPTLRFHVAGASGEEQVLELPPTLYVLETVAEEVKHVRKYLMGVLPVDLEVHTGKTHKVCVPAFGEMKYDTKLNGPVWIFGTPVFYQYRVGYNLKSQPPTVAFSDEPCGHCHEGEDSMASQANSTKVGLVTQRTLRRSSRTAPLYVSGPIRMPEKDTSLPL